MSCGCWYNNRLRNTVSRLHCKRDGTGNRQYSFILPLLIMYNFVPQQVLVVSNSNLPKPFQNPKSKNFPNVFNHFNTRPPIGHWYETSGTVHKPQYQATDKALV